MPENIQREAVNQDKTRDDLATSVTDLFKNVTTEVAYRNDYVSKRDEYIYGDGVRTALDIAPGHDFTGINWLRRTVEIHAMQFMGRGFQPTSTYDTEDPGEAVDDEDKQRIELENSTKKSAADTRASLMKAMMKDNGGAGFFQRLAENASSVGFAVVKTFYDDEEDKMTFSEVETVENFYTIWSDSDFRHADAYAYVWQISPGKAMREYGLSEDELVYTKAGEPFNLIDQARVPDAAQSTSSMITAMEVTGFIPGWSSEKGKLKKVTKGKETKINALLVGEKIVRLNDEEKKMPNYYIFPNKQHRRRPWGLSDVTDAAIDINLSYIETISDWRTVGNRVNFPKWKAFGFGLDTQLPTPKPRTAEMLPLGEGQDIQLLQQGDSNQVDFSAQASELREQYSQEVGLSRVFFNDPNLTLNSNQALMTSMKPTTDIAENKKVLWTPVLVQMFSDALETVSLWNREVKDVLDESDSWDIKIKWPTATPKEDPVLQTGLLNRLNANAISLTTYLEEMGEGKEELDRMKQDLSDVVTASIVSKQVAAYVQQQFYAGDGKPEPKVNVNLRGDLTPHQEGNLADDLGFQDGPFKASVGPQGFQGNAARENEMNEGFLEGNPLDGGTPVTRDAQGNEIPTSGQGARVPQQTPEGQTPANQEGQQPMSQAGSGAPSVSPEGAQATQNQNRGG